MNTDNLNKEYEETFKEIIYIKNDKNKSREYLIFKPGNLTLEHNKDDLTKYISYLGFKVLENNNLIYAIIDLHNYDRKVISVKYIVKIIILFKKLFPNKLEKCIIINATKTFKVLYNMVKMFIEKETRKRIEIRLINE